MKQNPIAILIGTLLLVVFVLLLFVYQVRTTEVAVVTTLGKLTSQRTDPGAHFRWPWPINVVYKLDKRIRNVETGLQQSTTVDDYSLLVMSYAGWSVDNPADFFPRFDRGSHVRAESAIKEMLLNAQKQVVGRHRLPDLINIDASQLKFAAIEQEILQLVQEQCKTQKYGIDIKFVGIKRLGLPESNTQAVMDRMRSERQKLVRSIEAEGSAAAAQIKSSAQIEAQKKISQANAEAIRIRGEGEAEVAKTLPIFEKNPELAKLLLDSATLEAILKDNSTLIMDPRWPVLKLLQPQGTLDGDKR